MRVNLVVAVGIMGEKEDVERFAQLMTADFEHRCLKTADKLFKGRIEIMLPEAGENGV